MVRTSRLLAVAGWTVALGVAALASPADHALQQAKSQIQSAYDAGQGKIGILAYPSAWIVVPYSFRYSKTIQAVTLTGNLAQVTVYQDDTMAAVDPKSGVCHVIRATMTYRDRWKHTLRGWFLKKSVTGRGQDTIDGHDRWSKANSGSRGRAELVAVPYPIQPMPPTLSQPLPRVS